MPERPRPARRRLILGTAGHIDHGKTTLVGALTGTDTDRLPEEKRRGITIDLGFATLALTDGPELAIVDVPGHESFVRNMLAGATGVDMVLLVVAADEGVMPQTTEHLAIVELLGVRTGVVALTKTDAADPEWLDLVREDVRALLAGSSLAGAPVVDVSARTGAGLDGLKSVLATAAASVAHRPDDDVFRMPVDRIFTVRGTGTVVTGTVWSGAVQRDATVRIEPAGATARVRALQRHGEETDRVAAGERAAVALAGFDRHALSRGDVLVTGAAWRPASMLTVDLTVLRDAPELVTRQRVRLHLGTAEVFGRLVLADHRLQPGATGLAQLRLESPVVARAGDRFVIRSYSPVRTIAGGVVLEPDAPKRKRFPPETAAQLHALRGEPAVRLKALLQLAGAAGVRRDELPLLAGMRPGEAEALLAGMGPGEADTPLTVPGGAVVIDDRVVAAQRVAECERAVLAGLAAFHAAEPLEPGPDREALLRRTGAERETFNFVVAAFMERGQVVQVGGGAVALAGHRPTPSAAQRSALASIRELLAVAALEPPDVAVLPGGADGALPLLRYLEGQHAVVRLPDGRWADARAVADAAARLRQELPPDTELPLAEFKNVLGLTRKNLLPLLEYFDGAGVCERRGESRIVVPESAAGAGPGTAPSAQVDAT